MKPMTARFGALSPASLLIGTACAPPTNTASTPPPLQGGQEIPVSYSVDGTEVYRATYVVRNLEEPTARQKDAQGVDTDLVALLASEDFIDPEYAKNRIAPSQATYEEIVAFLDAHWDEAIGGKDDPGRNVKEFLAVLANLGIDAPMFLAEFKKLGLSLSDYMKLIGYFDRYDDLLEGNGFLEIVNSLARYDLSLMDFLLYLRDAEVTLETFFAALGDKKQSFSVFLAESAASEEALQERLKDLVQPSIQSVGGMLRFSLYWDILQDGQPTAVSGYILPDNYGSVHRERYRGGRHLSSGKRSLVVGSPATPLVHCEWELSAQVGVESVDPEFPGKFIKDIKVTVHQNRTTQGWKLEGGIRTTKVPNWRTDPSIFIEKEVIYRATLNPGSGILFRQDFLIDVAQGIKARNGVNEQLTVRPLVNTMPIRYL